MIKKFLSTLINLIFNKTPISRCRKLKFGIFLGQLEIRSIRNYDAGFSVIEVILATAIFMILSTASITTILQGLSSNRLGKEQTVANQYAAEGIEAVRSIKNQGFSNLINSAGTGVIRSGSNVWAFGGSNNQFGPGNKYTRVLAVSDVQRDCSLNIVDSGGSIDPLTKKITSTVSWNFTPSRANSVQLTAYLSDWRKSIGDSGPIMMAYSKTTNTPYSRIWNGSSWSAESAGQTVDGNINYVVLKSSRTRNEAILGTMDVNGNIYTQVWNGNCWGTRTLIANVGTSLNTYRAFDIEYEKSGDRAVIAYLPNSSSADPSYRIWDGAAWSSPVTINSALNTGVIRWIELTQNPIATSNEIAIIMLNSNRFVYGMVWDGSAWNNMGVTLAWDTTASIATRKAIDVAYEQTSGRAMFIWGDSVTTDQYYRIWNGTVLTASTLLDIPASSNVASWVELVSRPNSDELMYGVLDSAADLNTRKWSGTAWDTATQHPEHSQNIETVSSMAFDIIWETHSANPGKAWLLMGNSNTVQKKQWSGTAWGSATTLTGSDDTSFLRLKADPISGAVFAGIYEDSSSSTDDIWESRLTGGGTAWSSKNTIWGGQTAGTTVYFRIDIAMP